jgi:phosphoglycolate phosphatase-like HAD superfamily hydrolase
MSDAKRQPAAKIKYTEQMKRRVKIGPEIRAIVWDFDGTLIDSFHIVKEIIDEITEAEKLTPITEAFLMQNYHGLMHETLHTALGGNLSDAELDRYMDMFLDKQTRYYEAVEEHLIDDAIKLLDQAKQAGLKQVIVTNRDHKGRGNASPYYLVEHSVMKDAIGHVIAGDDKTHRKPDPRVLEDYIREHNLKTHEIIVIGDQFVDGLLAMNLGAKAILVTRYGEAIAHLDQLGAGWEEHVTIVPDLHCVEL